MRAVCVAAGKNTSSDPWPFPHTNLCMTRRNALFHLEERFNRSNQQPSVRWLRVHEPIVLGSRDYVGLCWDQFLYKTLGRGGKLEFLIAPYNARCRGRQNHSWDVRGPWGARGALYYFVCFCTPRLGRKTLEPPCSD